MKKNTNIATTITQFLGFATKKGLFGSFNSMPNGEFFGTGVFFVSASDINSNGFPTDGFVKKMDKVKAFFTGFNKKFGSDKTFEMIFIPTFGEDFANVAANEKFFGFIRNFFAAGDETFEFKFKGFGEFFEDFNKADFSVPKDTFVFGIKNEFPFETFDFEREFSFIFADGEPCFDFPFFGGNEFAQPNAI